MPKVPENYKNKKVLRTQKHELGTVKKYEDGPTVLEMESVRGTPSKVEAISAEEELARGQDQVIGDSENTPGPADLAEMIEKDMAGSLMSIAPGTLADIEARSLEKPFEDDFEEGYEDEDTIEEEDLVDEDDMLEEEIRREPADFEKGSFAFDGSDPNAKYGPKAYDENNVLTPEQEEALDDPTKVVTLDGVVDAKPKPLPEPGFFGKILETDKEERARKNHNTQIKVDEANEKLDEMMVIMDLINSPDARIIQVDPDTGEEIIPEKDIKREPQSTGPDEVYDASTGWVVEGEEEFDEDEPWWDRQGSENDKVDDFEAIGLTPKAATYLRDRDSVEEAYRVTGDLERSLEYSTNLSGQALRDARLLVKGTRLEGQEEEVIPDLEIYRRKNEARRVLEILNQRTETGEWVNPKARDVFSNPKEAAIYRGSVEQLKALEDLNDKVNYEEPRLVKKMGKTVASSLARTAALVNTVPVLGFEAGVAGYDFYMGLMADMINRKAEEQGITDRVKYVPSSIKVPEYLKRKNNYAYNMWNKIAGDLQPKELKADLWAQIAKGDYLNAGKTAMLTSTKIATDMIPMYLAMAAGAPAVLATIPMVLQKGAENMANLEESNSLKSMLQRVTHTGVVMGNEWFFETLISAPMGKGWANKILNRGGKKGLKNFLTGLFGGVVSTFTDVPAETASEVLTELADTVADYFTGNKKAFVGLEKRLKNTALHAAFFTLGASGTANSISVMHNTAKANTKEKKKSFKKMGETVEELKKEFGDNAPALEKAVDIVAPGNVYIDSQKLTDVIQQAELDRNKETPKGEKPEKPALPVDLLKKLGISEETLKEKTANGQDVVTTRSKYLIHVAGGPFADLATHVDLSRKGLSPEREALLDERIDLALANEDYMTDPAEVPLAGKAKEFRGQAKKARNAEEATQVTSILRKFARKIGMETKETTNEVLERLGIEVRKAHSEDPEIAIRLTQFKQMDEKRRLRGKATQDAKKSTAFKEKEPIKYTPEMEMDTMMGEVERAEKDAGTKKKNKNKYPKWYKKAGLKDAKHLREILKNKKGPAYTRIKRIAAENAAEAKKVYEAGEGVDFQALPKGFYSGLRKGVAEAKFSKLAPDNARNLIKKQTGVTSAELEYSGLNDYLDIVGRKVTKEELLHFLDMGGMEIEEIELSDKAGTAKFGGFQIKGGTNYREFLLRFPILKTDKYFESDHWPKYTNVVVHFRTHERTNTKGKKTFHVEEIQSDWHQTGRAYGYDTKGELILPKNLELVHFGSGSWMVKTIPEEGKESKGIAFGDDKQTAIDNFKAIRPPEGPYSKTNAWLKLAIKRITYLAASEGFDAVSWTNGGVQAIRNAHKGETAKADIAFYDKMVPDVVKSYLKKKDKSIEITRDQEETVVVPNPGYTVADLKIENKSSTGYRGYIDVIWNTEVYRFRVASIVSSSAVEDFTTVHVLSPDGSEH